MKKSNSNTSPAVEQSAPAQIIDVAAQVAEAQAAAEQTKIAYKNAVAALNALKGVAPKNPKAPVPYKLRILELVGEAKFTQKEIMECVIAEFPAVLKSTVSTVLSDSKNPKYHSLPKLVTVGENGVLTFAE